nr:hypothetical protein [Azospirillum sp. 412522]
MTVGTSAGADGATTLAGRLSVPETALPDGAPAGMPNVMLLTGKGGRTSARSSS